jgi:DNA-binding NarL/FixJ family response regulator
LNPAKELRVLIAENHRDLRELMTELIDSEPGMQCVGQVSCANEVVEAARNSSADAVILDLMLQGGNGMSIIEELASVLPTLRIIVFSGYSSDELARESKRRGAAAFVTKGCDFSVLLDELRSSKAA